MSHHIWTADIEIDSVELYDALEKYLRNYLWTLRTHRIVGEWRKLATIRCTVKINTVAVIMQIQVAKIEDEGTGEIVLSAEAVPELLRSYSVASEGELGSFGVLVHLWAYDGLSSLTSFAYRDDEGAGDPWPEEILEELRRSKR